MLAVMSVGAYAPAAHAVTIDHLTVTVTSGTQSSTGTFRVVDLNSDGIITVPVGNTLLSQINSAFGTTTFSFPGSSTGTFMANGSTFTVTIQSSDAFMLIFTA